jgi:hypothetical protein
MKAIARRLRRLEGQFAPADGRQRMPAVVSKAGWEMAIDQDRGIEILDESGFPTTVPCGLVNLGTVPEGLNAQETERFLREHAPEICGRARAGTV